MKFVMPCFIVALVLSVAYAQSFENMEDGRSQWNLPMEPLTQKSIESLGQGFALVQPDIARVTLFSLLSPQSMQQGGQQQQQNTTAQPATAPTANATTGEANATQAANATGTVAQNVTQNTTQLPPQQQLSGSQNLESQLASQSSSQSTQLQQWLLQNGASNASVTEINMLRLSQNPVAVATIVFEAPVNNLQNILQNAMNNGASGIDRISFKASPQVLQQGSLTAINQAISDAQKQNQLISSLVGQGAQGGSSNVSTMQADQAANQTAASNQTQPATGPAGAGTGAQNILSVRVIDIIHVEEPAPEEVARSFLQMINELLLNIQQNGISSLLGLGGQQQQGGESSSGQQSSFVPVMPINVNMVKTKVAIRQSLQSTGASA